MLKMLLHGAILINGLCNISMNAHAHLCNISWCTGGGQQAAPLAAYLFIVAEHWSNRTSADDDRKIFIHRDVIHLFVRVPELASCLQTSIAICKMNQGRDVVSGGRE